MSTIPAKTAPRSLQQSQHWLQRAARVIPSCTQTFSKGPTQFVQGVAPGFLVRGEGCRVWDVDGNCYLDYAMALGPVILGHNFPAVTEAAIRQMRDGMAFTLPHPLEVEVAELLTEVIPCAEMVRFGKNGSDATAGAVRAARAFTGREVVACCGYHGWQDWYIGTTTRNQGVPRAVQQLTRTFEYNNLDSLQKIFAEHPRQVAAVILEPVGVVEPRDGFLEKVRELTHAEGAVLIFDEIITGFRLALGGAQQHYGVTPDLACFGKAMGNGFPVAAVVGSRRIMPIFDEIFFSFTFGGDALSLAASKATIGVLRERNVIAHLWKIGKRLQDGYNRLAVEHGLAMHTQCVGLAPRTVVTFQDATGADSLLLKSVFQQECLQRGVLFTGGHNVCFSHTEADIEETLAVYEAAMRVLAEAVNSDDPAKYLEGKVVEAVFRRA